MLKTIKTFLKRNLGSSQITKKGVRGYISRKEIKKAKKMNILLSQYMHQLYNLDVSETYKLCEEVVFPFIKDNQTVLEIGTGTGAFAEIILNKYKNLEYYSIEPNEDLKNYLSKHLSPFNFHSLQSNGYSLKGIDDDSIDVIGAHGVFVYLEHQITFNYFQAISKKLKPGGYFIFNMHNSDNSNVEFMAHMDKVFNYFIGRTLLPLNYVEKYFEHLGFKTICIKDYKEALDYSTYVILQKKKEALDYSSYVILQKKYVKPLF